MTSNNLPQTIHEALQEARKILSTGLFQDSIESEAEQIVMAAWQVSGQIATGKMLSRVELYSKSRETISPVFAEKVVHYSKQRAEGRPLQYIFGFQVFLNHSYEVNSSVLIPRPETEILYVTAFEELQKVQPCFGLEIGVGSGILSIELLSSFPKLTMIASELSSAAKNVAAKNAKQILGLQEANRLKIVLAENALQVWEPFKSEKIRADFLISNPPYLKSSSEVCAEVLAYEPHEALFAPEKDPLYFYREIAIKAHQFVRSGGAIFLEIPHERAKEIQRLFEDSNLSPKMLMDLNQRERVLVATVKE